MPSSTRRTRPSSPSVRLNGAPVVSGEALEAATVMNVTLSCDHRVVDGATGAALLGAFRAFMEDPVRMLV